MSIHPHTIRAIVNGQQREYPAGQTLLAVVQSLDLQPDRLAIEVDREIVKPAEWPVTEIRDGAEIEIVHFVGGG